MTIATFAESYVGTLLVPAFFPRRIILRSHDPTAISEAGITEVSFLEIDVGEVGFAEHGSREICAREVSFDVNVNWGYVVAVWN